MKLQIERINIFKVFPLIILTFVSCGPQYYNPIKQNVKVFENKGDIVTSINAQLIYNQLGIDAGYALTDNIGINTSYNRFNTSRYGGETNLLFKDFIWDNELIFYKNYKFGLFGAANLGYGRAGFNVCNPYYRLSMDRFFAQPSIGYILFDRLGIVFSTRFSQSLYNVKMQTDGYSESEKQMIQSYFGLTDIEKKALFIEPAVTLIVKNDNYAWKLQYIQSYTDSSYNNYSYENLILTYSLNLSNLLFHEKTKTN